MWRRNRLLRLLGVNVGIGIAVAAIAVAGLLLLDAHGLRRLILADASPGLGLVLLLFGFVITFGSVAMGAAIMALGRDADRTKPGLRIGADASGLAAQRASDGTRRHAADRTGTALESPL